MGIQDRDYMRRRPTRWDERTGEMRFDPDEPRRSSLDETLRRWKPWVLGGAAMVAVIVAGGWWYQRSATVRPEQVGHVPSTVEPRAGGASECLIKGNINSHGDRVGLLPVPRTPS